jgi:hypothetical protein
MNHSPLGQALFEVCQSQNLRHLAVQEAARNNPTVDALYRAWLILTDVSEDEPRHVLNDAITRAERILKAGLGL